MHQQSTSWQKGEPEFLKLLLKDKGSQYLITSDQGKLENWLQQRSNLG